MELKKYIKIIDGVFSEKGCDKLLNFLKKENFEEATIVGNDDNKGVTDFSIRKTYTYKFNFLSKSLTNVHWGYRINFCIGKALTEYQNFFKLLDFPLGAVEGVSALKYEKGGFYIYHVDHCPEIARTISIVILLNDEYKGGELSFRDPDGNNEIQIPVKKGRLIMWPSNFLFPHTVKPVIEGERYSIVAWVK